MIYLYKLHIMGYEDDEKILSLTPYISYERRLRVVKYIHNIDKIRCILGELLLRYIVKKHHGIDNNKISFQYNVYGKPSLKDYTDIQFNISHSGKWILCGVSDKAIGVDIEGGCQSNLLSIAERYFTNEEYNYIQSQSYHDQMNAFYKLWTLKESYIKCIGKGLSIPLNSFHFEFIGNEISLYQLKIHQSEYYFQTTNKEDEYHIAICSKEDKNEFYKGIIQEISMDELIAASNTSGFT